MFIAPWSGVGAITRSPVGIIREVQQTRDLLLQSIREVFEVAQANGVKLTENAVDATMDFIDNVMIERFWRSIKYEDIYLKSYENGLELEKGIKAYMSRYNHHRPHESLADATPEEIYSKEVDLAA